MPTTYVPAGFHSVTPYLIFDGSAAEAIEFYVQAFAAIELAGRVTDPAGRRVLNAEIKIGDSILRVGDEAPWRIARSPRSLGGTSAFVHLYVEDADAMVERAVALGARVLLPLQDQWYGDRSASIADPFGHTWTIATHREDLTPEELAQRFAAMMRQQQQQQQQQPQGGGSAEKVEGALPPVALPGDARDDLR
jgi:PhnB protein